MKTSLTITTRQTFIVMKCLKIEDKTSAYCKENDIIIEHIKFEFNDKVGTETSYGKNIFITKKNYINFFKYLIFWLRKNFQSNLF